jgi:lipopolysaccharide transport system ATP-binding protein
MSTVITVENLGKKYTLQHQQREQYTALRDVISNGVKNLSKKIFSPFTPYYSPLTASQEDFWALKDVSFEVKQGDRIGIIGRNGAGKSTLLKILSRITEPTTGSIRIKGRVASLLEVGTGFHPELTGRENIFLNGAILGMGRAEIKKKFDEIVAFAEIENFLDTPVKRYSSGMYVRLAFAVAAHLEPEILIVDEVLAVGDAQFQKKCLGKMEDVSAKEGRTVLFVSHNMSMINLLCTTAININAGEIRSSGLPATVISEYLKKTIILDNRMLLCDRKDRTGSGHAIFTDFKILNDRGEIESILSSGKDYSIQISFGLRSEEPIYNAFISIDIYDENGNRVLLFRNNFYNFVINILHRTGSVQCKIPRLPLAKGKYSVSLYMSYADTERLDYIEKAESFEVDGGDFFGTGNAGLPSHCKILSEAHWSKL